MSTIESIGVGGDYATPQLWYAAHAGNITSDVDAPYIGEIMPGTYVGSLDMSFSTTNATHYFHLRAKAGSEFKGVFNGIYPMLSRTGGSYIINVEDDYARIEGVCVGSCSATPNGITVSAVDHVLINRCGVFDMVRAGGILAGIYVEDDSTNVLITNCGIGFLRTTGVGAWDISGIVVDGTGTGTAEIYNNSINQLSASSTGNNTGIFVDNQLTAKIINNAIGVLDVVSGGKKSIDATAGTLIALNNGGENSTGLGTNGVSGWTSASVFVDSSAAAGMDLTLRPGQPGAVGAAGANPLRQKGLNLRKSLYTNAPLYDVAGDVRGINIPWDIGADGDAEGATKGTTTAGLLCKKSDGTYTYAQWRLFYPNCPQINAGCNPLSGAFVACSTVCQQSLW